jgi:hypothetical protein
MGVTVGRHNRCPDYTGDVAPPFDVALVLDFLNTVDVEDGTDVLGSSGSWAAWTRQRDLRADDLPSARQARDALRAAVGDPTLPPETAQVDVQVVLSADGPTLAARTAVGAVLAAASRLVITGAWERIKICPADDCLWAFYDKSRNRSRTWCSMQVCGNREKARAWRERTARGDT